MEENSMGSSCRSLEEGFVEVGEGLPRFIPVTYLPPTEGHPFDRSVDSYMVADNTSPNEAGERVVEFGDGMYNLDKGEGYRNLSRKETEYLADVFPVKPEGTVQVKAEGKELYLQRNGRRIEITEDQDFTFGYFFPELEAVAGGTTRDPQEEKGLGTLGKVAALGICAGAALAGGAYSLMDSDGDKVNNIGEWLGPTDYRNPDTDSDTLKDGVDDHPTKNDFPVTSYAEKRNLPASVLEKLKPLDEDLTLDQNEKTLVNKLSELDQSGLTHPKIQSYISSVTEGGEVSEGELEGFPKTAPLTSYAKEKGLPVTVQEKLKPLDEDLKMDSKERFLVDVISNHSSEIAGNQTFLDELSGATEDEEITKDEINYLASVGVESSQVPSNIPHGVRKQKAEIIDEEADSIQVSNFELMLDYTEGNLKDSLANFSVKNEKGKIGDVKLMLDDSYELSPEDGSYGESVEEFSRVLGSLEEGNLYKGEVKVGSEGNSDLINFKIYPREFVNIADDDNMKIVAHYFPWKFEKNDEDLVYHLLMGDYNPTNQEDINKHIDWATGHGIDAFSISWNGINNHTTNYIDDYILEADLIDDVKFMIDLDQGSWNNPLHQVNLHENTEDRKEMRDIIHYFNKNYFSNPQYLEIKDKKPIFFYGSRVINKNGDIEGALEEMREITEDYGNELYIIGDRMGFGLLENAPWVEEKLEKMRKYDAITSFTQLYHDFEGDYKDFIKKKY